MSPPLSPPPREWRRATGKRLHLVGWTQVELKLGFQRLLPFPVRSGVDQGQAVIHPTLVVDTHSATSIARWLTFTLEP